MTKPRLKPSKLGAIVLGSTVCPIERLRLHDGKLEVNATIPTPCKARHGMFKVSFQGEDRKEVLVTRVPFDHDAMDEDVTGHMSFPIELST